MIVTLLFFDCLIKKKGFIVQLRSNYFKLNVLNILFKCLQQDEKKKSLLSCFSHIMNNYHDFEEQQVSVCLEIAVPSPA